MRRDTAVPVQNNAMCATGSNHQLFRNNHPQKGLFMRNPPNKRGTDLVWRSPPPPPSSCADIFLFPAIEKIPGAIPTIPGGGGGATTESSLAETSLHHPCALRFPRRGSRRFSLRCKKFHAMEPTFVPLVPPPSASSLPLSLPPPIPVVPPVPFVPAISCRLPRALPFFSFHCAAPPRTAPSPPSLSLSLHSGFFPNFKSLILLVMS